MSSKGRSIIITQTKQSPLPTCSPNLMPFHIRHTGPAAVSMFLRVEKMKLEEEAKEQIKKTEEAATVVVEKDPDGKVDESPPPPPPITNPVQVQDSQSTDVEMETVLPTVTSSLPSPTPIPSTPSPNKTLPGSIQASDSTSTLKVSSESIHSSFASSSSNLLPLPEISSSVLKDIDKRFISSFRGRTIHGLTVDLPTGYMGLLLQGDPEPTATHADRVARVLDADVKSGFEGKNEDEEEWKSGRKTRSKGKGVVGNGVKGKGKAKGKEMEPTKKAPPKGRLVRTAAPRRVVEPEVITVDQEDQEMADPAPSTNITATEPPIEVTDSTSKGLELINDDDDTNTADWLDNDLGVDKGIPLRKLIPQSTFSSITLWHADRAVDETRDEYYRTLTEWMALSHEVRIYV